PGLFDMLKSIQQDGSDFQVSVALVIAESAEPEISRSAREGKHSVILHAPKVATRTEFAYSGIVARPVGANVLLLDPGVLISPASVRRMMDVLHSDDMIGFVVPRSNVPILDQFSRHSGEGHPDSTSAEKLVDTISQRLPRFHFIPAPSFDCLL